MRKLFVVDYRENGAAKHQCIEVEVEGIATEAALVTVCHIHIGMGNELDSVVEVFSDMSASELEKIVLTPKLLFLPRRNLYVNVEEIKRCVQILKEA